MSDRTGTITATDQLSLSGLWVPQNNQIQYTYQIARMTNSDGDYLKFSDAFDEVFNCTSVYKYNSTTDLGNALSLIYLGSVKNGWLITNITVETNWNDYPVVTFTSHNHLSNAHTDNRNKYTWPTELTAKWLGDVGAIDLSGNADDDTGVCIQSSTATFSLNHVDENCGGTGSHWVGDNIQCECQIVDNYVGAPDAFAALSASWRLIEENWSDSNEEFEKSSCTQIRPVTRNA